MHKLKWYQKLIVGSIVIAMVLVLVILLTNKRMDFNFANEGKIICVEHRDWGIIKKGDLTCFAVVPLSNGIDQLLQTVQTLDKNGEVVLKKLD